MAAAAAAAVAVSPPPMDLFLCFFPRKRLGKRMLAAGGGWGRQPAADARDGPWRLGRWPAADAGYVWRVLCGEGVLAGKGDVVGIVLLEEIGTPASLATPAAPASCRCRHWWPLLPSERERD